MSFQCQGDGVGGGFCLGDAHRGAYFLLDGDGGQQTVIVVGVNQQVVGLLLGGVVRQIGDSRCVAGIEIAFRVFQYEGRISVRCRQFTFIVFFVFFQYVVQIGDVGLILHLHAFLASYSWQGDTGCFQFEVGGSSVVGYYLIVAVWIVVVFFLFFSSVEQLLQFSARGEGGAQNQRNHAPNQEGIA